MRYLVILMIFCCGTAHGAGSLETYTQRTSPASTDAMYIEVLGSTPYYVTLSTLDTYFFTSKTGNWSTTGTIGGADITITDTTPLLTLDSSSGADGFVLLTAADADDSVLTIGVDDSTGDDVAYIELDGVNERIETNKPLVLGGNVTIGGYELQSAGGVVVQLGDTSGAFYFEIEDSGSADIFTVDSNGAVNASSSVSAAGVISSLNIYDMSASPKIFLDDTDGADGFVAVAAGDADDAVLTIGVDDSSGDDQTYIELDGVNEQIEINYPVVSSSSVLAATNVVTTTDGALSPTAAQMYGSMFIADNATADNDTDYTLPSAVAGMSACFYDNGGGGGGIIIDAAAGDIFLLNGAALDAGDAIDSPGVAAAGANGDSICIVAIDDTYWVTMYRSGTWVDGGAD